MTVLARRVDGAGEPLLLLNGGLMSIAAWDPLIPRLAARHRVVRCDFRGQLLSLPLGPPPARLSGHVADLLALVDALHLDRVHVAGTSFGGFVGLVFAATHPDRVRSLAVIAVAEAIPGGGALTDRTFRDAIRAAAAGGDGRAVLDRLAPYTFSPEWLAAHRDAFDARRDQFLRLPPAWYEGLDGLLRALEGLDLRPLLPHLAVPTLVVAAERDRTFPLERARAVAEAIPGATLVVMPRAAHGVIVEEGEACADLLLSFTAQHPGCPESLKGVS